jgi:hypothetical protein
VDPGADVECRVQTFEEGGVRGCFDGCCCRFLLLGGVDVWVE